MTLKGSFALLSCRFNTICFSRKRLWQHLRKLYMDKRNDRITNMEIVNIPPIVSVYRQALHTFDNNYKRDLISNMNRLKKMMDTLRAEDLGFDHELCNPERWRDPNKAPCTYVEVFENNVVNMSIFVLKPGFKMPLHDHPHMHGLLKVIAGAVRIRSFSEHPLTDTSVVDFATRAKHEAARLAQGLHVKRRLFARIDQYSKCKENSETCVLTPSLSNYHEIEALSLPAAFFDILAPPYDTLIQDIGPRRCRYYRVNKEISTNLVELKETKVPDCFYCDQAPYLGPLLPSTSL